MVSNKLDLQKKQHRERSQPAHRKKLGLLEKHDDYVKRARDFHSKEDRIQKLREKAAFRNKDEFYFGMVGRKTKNGVHIQSRGNEPLPQDLVTVLKTQDAGYIRSQVMMEQGRVERLQQQLDALVDDALPPRVSTSKAGGDEEDMMNGDEWDMYDDYDMEEEEKPKRNHVVFTDDLDAVRSGDTSTVLRKRSTPTSLPSSSRPSSSASAHGETRRRRNKGKGKATAGQVVGEEDREEREMEEEKVREEAVAHRTQLREELLARQSRLLQLRRAARELDLQRALMGRGAKQQLVRKDGGKGDKAKKDEEWWLGGGKSGTGKDGAGEGGVAGVYQEEGGEKTGARVWKWKAQRKR
ncbi:hypothetical protein JCM8547_001438 [Rhodosporidiobolus lusitaniae]